MTNKRYWLEKWKEMLCDIVSWDCLEWELKCGDCLYYADYNLIKRRTHRKLYKRAVTFYGIKTYD